MYTRKSNDYINFNSKQIAEAINNVKDAKELQKIHGELFARIYQRIAKGKKLFDSLVDNYITASHTMTHGFPKPIPVEGIEEEDLHKVFAAVKSFLDSKQSTPTKTKAQPAKEEPKVEKPKEDKPKAEKTKAKAPAKTGVRRKELPKKEAKQPTPTTPENVSKQYNVIGKQLENMENIYAYMEEVGITTSELVQFLMTKTN